MILFKKRRIDELEKRVSALEKGATAKTWRHGEVDLKKLARIVDDIEKPSAATDGNEKQAETLSNYIRLEASPEEIAALALELQERQEKTEKCDSTGEKPDPFRAALNREREKIKASRNEATHDTGAAEKEQQ